MRTMALRTPRWLGQVPLAGRARLGDSGELTDENFDVAMNAPAAAVDFWSPMCAPCLQYKPVFEAAAAQAPDNVFMATMNADYSAQTMERYKVESLPTTLYLVGGQEVGRTEGKQTKETVLEAVGRISAQVQPQPAPAAAVPAAQPAAAQPSPAPAQTPAPVRQPAPQRAAPAAPGAPAPAAHAPAASAPFPTWTVVAGGVALVALTAGIVLLSTRH